MTEKKERTFTADMNMYEMNKQLMLQTGKPLTQEEIDTAQEVIDNWFNWVIDTYAMLLCHERRDYTVFHLYETQNLHPTEIAAKELIACLKERGTIYSIEKTEDEAWEIWLKIGKEFYCYYLFRYDNAVIEC